MQNSYTKAFLCIIPILLFYMIRENYWIDKIDDNERNRKVWIFTAGFAEGLEVWLGLSRRLKPAVWNHKSKLDLSTELSTDASTDLPSALYQKERIEDLRMAQEVLKEPEDETSDENIELEDDPEDEIKATFDRRLKILKRACSVLPQLRGANDLASHNQLIRKGSNRTGCSEPFSDTSNLL